MKVYFRRECQGNLVNFGYGRPVSGVRRYPGVARGSPGRDRDNKGQRREQRCRVFLIDLFFNLNNQLYPILPAKLLLFNIQRLKFGTLLVQFSKF